MANPARFSYIDPAAASDTRRRSTDPHVLERSINAILYYLYTSIPDLPVSAAARLSALAPAPGADADGLDHISGLPDALLRNIVSRLPVKDAASIAALSRRWRPVWRSTPLVLDDTNLLSRAIQGRPPVRAGSPALTAAVSRVLLAHPGPFRVVYLVRSYMDAHQQVVALWLRLLVLKGVQELVLVNRPWPLDVPLTVTLLNIATLSRLFIGVWKFPDTSGLPRGAGFPHLRELILCCVAMKKQNMDFVLAGSPVLETLGLQGIQEGVRLRLVSRHLKCVQICLCVVETIDVVDAPSLEWLILWGSLDGSCIRLKIGHATKLRLVGYLEPGIHTLEISDDNITMPGKGQAQATWPQA